MMVFWAEKKINVKELGKRLYLDSGTLTPALKSLEAKGYVHRYRSTEDERVLFVEITEAGESLKEQAGCAFFSFPHNCLFNSSQMSRSHDVIFE